MGKELAGGAAPERRLLSDVRTLIEAAKEGVARTANSALVMLYWGVGTRIREDILRGKRASYGRQIVATLSPQLVREHGAGYTPANLFRMIQFATVFPDRRIVATLWRQLGWSHFREIIPLEDSLKRDFYAEMCRIERWSVRTLRAKIAGMLYERTALSRKPAALAAREVAALRAEDRMTPDMVFQDPYLLGFLGLKDAYREKDLEAAILRKMEEFLLELGAGFAFIARQKRIEWSCSSSTAAESAWRSTSPDCRRARSWRRSCVRLLSPRAGRRDESGGLFEVANCDFKAYGTKRGVSAYTLHLAAIYGVMTMRLNEQVRRNASRFPADFMFQLTIEENERLISQIAISKIGRGGRRKLPLVFTQEGVAMLSSVLQQPARDTGEHRDHAGLRTAARDAVAS